MFLNGCIKVAKMHGSRIRSTRIHARGSINLSSMLQIQWHKTLTQFLLAGYTLFPPYPTIIQLSSKFPSRNITPTKQLRFAAQ